MIIQATSQTSLLIVGMRCNRCREVIAEALEDVAGVNDVHVDLYRSQAIISHGPQCEAEKLTAAIVQAGYGAWCASGQSAGETANVPCPNCNGQPPNRMKGTTI